ncbi:MAG: phytanoyl-CoA dioxygenase family protein [Alphaproteobacteria bacterium]|nr:phytanoyl-CoA dioxygenase family protein [Alphaproteobacteria bacterium]
MLKTKPDAGAAIDRDGFAIVPNVIPTHEIERLRAAVCGGTDGIQRRGSTYGGRNLLALPEVRRLAADGAVRDLIEPIVGPDAIPVRALFFDKIPEANWPVLWHQDLTIAVAERHDLEGWGPWSVKAGVPHVEPPAALLAGMLTIRLHLDDSHADNGPLRVIPGSHRLGRLSRDRIQATREKSGEAVCTAPSGSALLMRPLLLHASSPARSPSHRRVIHLEFARAEALPQPLRWHHERSTQD